MTNASTKNLLFAFLAVTLSATLSLGAFAMTVNAQEFDGYDFASFDSGVWGGFDAYSDFDAYGSNDFEAYGNPFDAYGYNDFEAYGNPFDAYGYNDFEAYGNGFDAYSNDFQPYGNDFEAYNNDFQPYANDFQAYGNDFQPYENDFQAYANDFQPYSYETENGYWYADSSYGGGSYHSQPMSVTPPSYSTPSRPSYPSFPSYPSYPTYPTYPSYPQPKPTPVPTPSYTNINTTTNTCTNNSCNNTLIDNSINGSFNSNVTTLGYVTPQPIIQYQFPTYPVTPTYQNLYCTITVNQASVGNGNTAWLSWTSYGATSAQLSDGIGRVAVSGTLAVRPESSRNYVLTVWGVNGQTATCNVTLNVTGTAPYVSLTQIPFTGFDFGTFGNAIYWMSLISFAVAGAYLAIYYKGGAFALAMGMFPKRAAKVAPVVVAAPVAAPAPSAPRPAQSSVFASLPTMESNKTKDTMSIVRTVDGAPRIIINRA